MTGWTSVMVITEGARVPWCSSSCTSPAPWRGEEGVWGEEKGRVEEVWREQEGGEMPPPYLPRDPRSWTREEVGVKFDIWSLQYQKQLSLKLSQAPEFFHT